MTRARNIAFSILMAALLAIFCGSVIARFISLQDNAPTRSYLEGRTYQAIPKVTADAVSSGSFQDESEQFAADSVPHRDNVIIVNAKIQRLFIKASCSMFGYSEYPTFYGSHYVFSSRWDSVSDLPDKQNDDKLDALPAAIEAIKHLTTNHPNIHWAMALTDRSCNSSASPAHDLVSNPADYPYLAEKLSTALNETGCDFIDLSIDNTDTYFQSYFTTDHHWRIEGAFDAYRKIIRVFGKEPIEKASVKTVYKGPFYGSEARNGRCIETSDCLNDVEYRRSKLKVYVNGEKKPQSYLDSGYDSPRYKKEHKYENVYADYFHGDPQLIEIRNSEIEDDSSLLIIGDSFTNNIERVFAESYSKVYVIDPRSYKNGIAAFLDNHNIDDALFLASSNTVLDNRAIAELLS